MHKFIWNFQWKVGKMTEIQQIVTTKVETAHKLIIIICGAKDGMTTIKVGKAVDGKGNLIRPTEFVFRSQEIPTLIEALSEYNKAL